MIYVFGDYALDTCLYELRHGGEPCPLGPQVFNVLAYLIAHRDRVVTKDELIEHLWPAQCVSDATVHQHVTAARKATGDSGRQQRIIKTLRSRGYRFIAPVEVRDDEALGRDGPVASEAAHHAAQQVLQPAVEAPPILHGALIAERKLVTVLGGTLANAVTLVERLGLEALPRLRQAWLDLVEHEVQPYHGTLQAVGNDSFLVLFGVPVALEDHARRAVLAGLALQRRLHQPYQDPGTQIEVAFEVCLGVHTGPVMVGSSPSEPQQPATVVGEVTHLVTRLQQLAAPGMLLGSEDTLQLVHGEVRSAACGSVAIPGRPEPLKAYAIHALGPWRASLGWQTGRALSRFVGRERELAMLDALLDRAVQGQGHVVGIMGEPGMGKSRLLYEFVQHLASKAVTYVEGHCLSYGNITPYLPVLDLLRHLCGITDADGPETLAAKVHGCLGDTGGGPQRRCAISAAASGGIRGCRTVGHPQPTNAQDPDICDAAAAVHTARSSATTRAGCGGSALDRPDVGRMAGVAGGVSGSDPAPPADNVPAGVSTAVDGQILCDATRADTADTRSQLCGGPVGPSDDAALRRAAAGDRRESGRQSLLSGGVDAGRRGTRRPSCHPGDSGHRPGGARGAHGPVAAGRKAPPPDRRGHRHGRALAVVTGRR